MTSIDIYRPGSPPTLQATVNIDERTTFQKKLMGDHAIVSEFVSSTIIDIAIGDYLTYNSESYFLNRVPSIEKINNSVYKYSVRFESVLYDLNRKLFISSDGLADYSYNGSATDFITNIVSSINNIASGWSVGTVNSSEDITLQFTNESCRAALSRVAEAFSMEFSLTGKAISLLNSVGSNTAYRFEYGKGLGLYKLTRQQVSDQNILTKVYGFGATKNIPSTYRSGAKRLVFESRYLTKNTALYGTIEGQYTDDNIFPQRTGTLTGVSYTAASGWNSNTDYLTDSAMDFDVNSYRIEGQTATIVFKSGDNSGVECEIWKYVNATKRFYINVFKDTDGYIQPNALNHPHTGDSYTLINISMPASYVTTAETALQVATQTYINENCIPMVVYSVDIDPKYAESIALALKVGDKVTVVDASLGINSLIRVSGIEFPLVDPYKIKAVIADFVPYTLQERIVKAAISNRKETIFVDRRRAEQARRNTVNQKTMQDLLFDSDMYFDATNIKPLSIETAYLAVGTKSRDFWLSNVTIKANYLGDANRIYASAGSLVHLQIQITGLGYTWVIGTPLDQGSLTAGTAYYLYAKCSKAVLTGEWILSASQITFEQVTGYYHFLTGMLFAVAGTFRDFDFTYGMTYINGGTITTGKIQSIDTNNYFDLTNNKFHIGDANGYVDWNAASGVLGIKGSMIITNPGDIDQTALKKAAASGATVGATWGSNISSQPTNLAGINATEGSKLTGVASGATAGATWGVNIDGSNKPANNATVGATWGTDLNSIPGRLASTAPDNSLAFTNDFLGFHASGTNWPIKIANDAGVGKFYAGDGGSNYMDWNGTTLTIHGVFSGIDSNLSTVAVPAGNLSGSVVNTQANVTAVARVDHIDLTGSSGSAIVVCNAISRLMTFSTNLEITADNFVAAHAAAYTASGVTVAAFGTGTDVYLKFTANVAGTNFTGTTSITNDDPNLSGTASTSVANRVAVKQVDTITLTGTSGTANLLCDAVTKLATFFNSLTDTAAGFVILWAASYLTGGVVVTSSGVTIIFTSSVAGTAFTGATTITNVANTERGNIKLEGDHIWENIENNDDYGVIKINLKGYQGGITKYRKLFIGDGRGNVLMSIYGTTTGSVINMYSGKISMIGLPTSDPGSLNRLWISSGVLKISGY